MTHQTLTAILVSSASGYVMLWSGIAKKRLALGGRGRCRSCGRIRLVCTCDRD